MVDLTVFLLEIIYVGRANKNISDSISSKMQVAQNWLAISPNLPRM